MPHLTRRATLALVVALGTVTLLLTACTPGTRSAVRVNADGSVDFASCIAVEDVASIEAETYMRTGPNGQLDDTTLQMLVPPEGVRDLAVGEVVSFSGLPRTWDELYVYVVGDVRVYGGASHRDIAVGEWYWDDSPILGIFPVPMVPAERCEIIE